MYRYGEVAREVLEASKLAVEDPTKLFAISFFDDKSFFDDSAQDRLLGVCSAENGVRSFANNLEGHPVSLFVFGAANIIPF